MRRFAATVVLLVIAASLLMAISGVPSSTVASNPIESTDSQPTSKETASKHSKSDDPELAHIVAHPHAYRFVEQVTDEVAERGLIKIHSTAPLADKSKYVQLRAGSVRYFRTDGESSDDGTKALIHWSIDGVTHSTKIGTPGSVIMVVRSLDGVVTWYSLQIDMRC